MQNGNPEHLVIRPPSEHRSLLIRVTRGCKWNRCRFCGIYPSMGQPDFSVRSVDEIKKDIDLLREKHSRLNRAFLGDADPLLIGLAEFVDILQYLRSTFPELTRVTCYARASTAWKLGPEGLKKLADSGLDRIHAGLESGDPRILKFHRKGLTPEIAVESGKWIRQAGIELSWYVLLGMGGKDLWKQHAVNTAVAIDQACPEFVRIRRLWIYGDGSGNGPESPLWESVKSGHFKPQSPEGTVIELREIIAGIEKAESLVTCDHGNNYFRIDGRLPDEKNEMLAEIDEFLSLPEDRKEAHYRSVRSQI